jgi:hypothetical protein
MMDYTRHDISKAGVAQLVERHLAKVQVAGSNPVSRSTSFSTKQNAMQLAAIQNI